MNLKNVRVLCSAEGKKYINYIKDKKLILDVFCFDNLPFFVLLSDEIFLFGVLSRDDFVVGFVTSECLERFGFVFNV
jgi:hypothetical protein